MPRPLARGHTFDADLACKECGISYETFLDTLVVCPVLLKLAEDEEIDPVGRVCLRKGWTFYLISKMAGVSAEKVEAALRGHGSAGDQTALSATDVRKVLETCERLSMENPP